MTKEERWVLEEKYAGVAGPGFEEDRRRLASGEPAAYIIGWQPFLGLTIQLDSHPLIPRPETEWWTEKLIEHIKKAILARKTDSRSSRFSFIDLCAGSGAIGCAALARLPDAQVFFGEIDPVYGATIQKNIETNHLDASRADIRIGDLFEPFGDERFDFIAANPPYIPASRELEESVKDYEPAQALYGGADGLSVIRRIAAELPRHLTKEGTAWVECDSPTAETARALFEASGMKTEVRTDQYEVPRVVVVSFP